MIIYCCLHPKETHIFSTYSLILPPVNFLVIGTLAEEDFPYWGVPPPAENLLIPLCLEKFPPIDPLTEG